MDNRTILKGALLAAVLLGAGGTSASSEEAGKAEYMASCASCHGESGSGDGPLAEIMTVKVPDLTGIAARNDGVFPFLKMLHVIDGRTGVRGHGYPMPVWGTRFKAAAVEESGDYGAEIIVRGRVLSLAYYLESIQQ